MWTVDYESDIASDLSAFHRIDDPMTIDGPRYFMLAIRLAAYAGVLAARAEKMRQDEKEGRSGAYSATPTASVAAPSSATGPSRVSDDAAIAMLADGWVEHTTTEGTSE